MNLYEALGLEKTATTREVRDAFRRLAKIHHPDAGGDAEMFNLITLAKDVLTDAKRRARYDETGQTEDPSMNDHAEVWSLIENMMQMLINNEGAEFTDVIPGMILSCEEATTEGRLHLRTEEKKLKRLVKLKTKFKKKSASGVDVVDRIMSSKIKTVEGSIENINKTLTLVEKAKAIISDYDFTPEKKPPTSTILDPNQFTMWKT